MCLTCAPIGWQVSLASGSVALEGQADGTNRLEWFVHGEQMKTEWATRSSGLTRVTPLALLLMGMHAPVLQRDLVAAGGGLVLVSGVCPSLRFRLPSARGEFSVGSPPSPVLVVFCVGCGVLMLRLVASRTVGRRAPLCIPLHGGR